MKLIDRNEVPINVLNLLGSKLGIPTVKNQISTSIGTSLLSVNFIEVRLGMVKYGRSGEVFRRTPYLIVLTGGQRTDQTSHKWNACVVTGCQ
jgi:hypothetical protein